MDYVQCRIKRPSISFPDHMWSEDTVWLPEKFAVVGKVVKIKSERQEWEDGWKVTDVYGKRPELEVLAASNFYRHHREATDI